MSQLSHNWDKVNVPLSQKNRPFGLAGGRHRDLVPVAGGGFLTFYI